MEGDGQEEECECKERETARSGKLPDNPLPRAAFTYEPRTHQHTRILPVSYAVMCVLVVRCSQTVCGRHTPVTDAFSTDAATPLEIDLYCSHCHLQPLSHRILQLQPSYSSTLHAPLHFFITPTMSAALTGSKRDSSACCTRNRKHACSHLLALPHSFCVCAGKKECPTCAFTWIRTVRRPQQQR